MKKRLIRFTLAGVFTLLLICVFVGCECKHVWQEATCDSPRTCVLCGEISGEALSHIWQEATCTTPSTCLTCQKTDKEALGHAWVDATCTTAQKCSRCHTSQGDVPGHSWVDATCTAATTCSVCGTTVGDPLAHSFIPATCTVPKTCSVCGTKEGSALNHTWIAATCTFPKRCSACGLKEGSATGHDWEAATCTLPKICSQCGSTDGSAAGHRWISATCTTAQKCRNCGETLGKALGHVWVDATCTASQYCSRCNQASGAPLGHNYVDGECTRCYHRTDGHPDFSDTYNSTVTFFVRTGYENEIASDSPNGDVLSEAVYYRNQTVTEALGVKLAYISQPGNWNYYQYWNSTLRNAIQTVSHDFDAAMIYAGTGSSLATEGCFLDLLELDFLSLDKEWWSQSIIDQATVYGSLYFATGSIAHSQIGESNVIWYNKNIYNQYIKNNKDLYTVVRNGEWTIDYMYELTSAVFEDLDNDRMPGSMDTVGWSGVAGSGCGAMDAWLYALGCDLTVLDHSIGEPVACFFNNHTVEAYGKLVKLYSQNPGAYIVSGAKNVTFGGGSTMMQLGTLNYGLQIRGVEFQYAPLPLPKYNVNQTNYRSISEVTSSLVTVLSTVESDRIDMVSSTIEYMAMEAHTQINPSYISAVLPAKATNADKEMVNIILDSKVYSFGWIFSSTNMGDMGKAFRVVDGSRDITEYYESKKVQYEAAIDNLINKFAWLD